MATVPSSSAALSTVSMREEMRAGSGGSRCPKHREDTTSMKKEWLAFLKNLFALSSLFLNLHSCTRGRCVDVCACTRVCVCVSDVMTLTKLNLISLYNF